jgi:hypothetical protein
MADFCYQCSVEMDMLYHDGSCDLTGLTTDNDTRKGLFMPVICESCGPTMVDHRGLCIGGCEGSYMLGQNSHSINDYPMPQLFLPRK